MTDEVKDRTIHQIYYGRSGFGSPNQTFADAKAKDPTIRLDYVRDWFRRNIERTKPTGGGKNSFVAPRAYHEYQADIFFITEKQLPKQDYPYGLSCIDIFSKYATVVPIKARKHEDIMNGLLQCFKNIGKQPEILMTDPESALFKREVKEAFDDMNIQHIMTQSSAHFVERFHRTFRGMLQKRLDFLQNKGTDKMTKIRGKTTPNLQWHTLIPEILKVYNNKNIHTATGKTPAEATKPSHEADVKTSMELRAKRGRKYPDIEVGDRVRVIRKKILGDKEYTGNFRQGINTVESISENFGHKFYKLDDRREYIRSDIVKV